MSLKSFAVYTLFALPALALGCTGTSGPSSTGSLTGMWDLTAAKPGHTAATGTLVLSPTVLTITLGESVLAYTLEGGVMTASFTDQSRARAIAVQQSGAASSFDPGAFPIAIGGSWSFHDPIQTEEGCTLSLAGGSGSATCQRVAFPSPLPRPTSGATYTMTRTASHASMFGDFGGDWSLARSAEAPGCTASFKDATFSATCTAVSSSVNGGLQIAFNGDTASGTTDVGVELSAHRR